MTGRRVLWFGLRLGGCVGLVWLVLTGGLGGKGDGARADDNTSIDKVRSTWRAQDGETPEEIFAKVSAVAHFVPRGLKVVRRTDTGEPVVVSWAKHRSDKPKDEYTVTWEEARDGTSKLLAPYEKPMELGWQAFELSLIADEVTNNERGVNRRFLPHPANFNFVTTAQGKLGDLLRRGRGTIGEPVGVHYSPKVDEQQAAEGDLARRAFGRLAIFPDLAILPATESPFSRSAKGRFERHNPSLPNLSPRLHPTLGLSLRPRKTRKHSNQLEKHRPNESSPNLPRHAAQRGNYFSEWSNRNGMLLCSH
ncbi:hypothetical protein [Bradyrhizobium sp. AC87j1]|uniref:hypothetical protein n=1 Tax=Bradyrhizobium sp. AC87j1 TaxID=2055894 RepID=UPI0011B08C1F|nr:hypothetical protein [Bradyrhizobium sp. AC87j1]